MDTKVCSKCGEEKELNNFYFRKDCCSYRNECYDCGRKYQKRMYDKEKVKEYNKKYIEKNKERIKMLRKEYYQKNKNVLSQKMKEYRKKNRKKILDSKRRYFQENKDREIQKNLVRRNNSPRFKLRHKVSNLIYMQLKRRNLNKNSKSTFGFLPYTLEDLMHHLESKFKLHMSWNNYGEWHIDHIIPNSRFNYTTVEDKEFQKCWALENLQPLWAEENLRKNRF